MRSASINKIFECFINLFIFILFNEKEIKFILFQLYMHTIIATMIKRRICTRAKSNYLIKAYRITNPTTKIHIFNTYL